MEFFEWLLDLNDEAAKNGVEHFDATINGDGWIDYFLNDLSPAEAFQADCEASNA